MIEDDYFSFTVLDSDEVAKFDAILKGINGLDIQKMVLTI